MNRIFNSHCPWAAIAVVLSHAAAVPTSAAAADNLVKPTEVRKVYGNGKHNAFTALARFHGAYWLAFRTAAGHNSADGDILVLRSKDTKSWTEALRLNACPDDRDPQIVATDKKLLLYDAGMTGPELVTYLVATEDGKTWTKPQPVYEKRFIVWKPTLHEGKFYSAAHKKDEASGGKGREVRLITSDDGVEWKTISTIRRGKWESETTLYIEPWGHITGFMRQKYGSPPAAIFESDPPYAAWKERKPDVNHFSGHSVHTFAGTTYLLSRTIDYATRKTGVMIYTFAGGKLTPYCALPAGGDCAYAEAVQLGDDMLVSYYSSHEGATNIYLATVPLTTTRAERR